MSDKIDFVIIWVDGNDPKWQEEKNKYSPNNKDSDTRNIRYRDWDNLQYWFRGVEKFAPWVNNIYFVTWGHIPTWLNINHPKLQIVKHKDFIPEKYLPTFSSHPIENNLHRIEGLEEQFVYFNDDMFLIKPTKKTDFFKNDKPCDSAFLNANISYRENNTFVESVNMSVINDYFIKNEVIRSNFTKWFNLKYGLGIIRTICLLPWKAFPGIHNSHLPTSFIKSTYKELWEKEYDILDETCSHKFRYALDVNQWLFKNWQMVKGDFCPRTPNIGKSFALDDDKEYNNMVYDVIRKQKYKMVCVNDMVNEDDFETCRDDLKRAFNDILPEKSGFEL